MSDKKPVRSLEDIDDNLEDEEDQEEHEEQEEEEGEEADEKDQDIPTEEDVLREKLKEQQQEQEEDQEDEQEEDDQEPEEQPSPMSGGIKKASELRGEPSNLDEDPLDAGEDDPEYEEDLKQQEQPAEDQNSTVNQASESTLDDLAHEQTSEPEEEIPNLRSQRPIESTAVPSQIGGYQSSDYNQNPNRTPFVNRYNSTPPRKSSKWHLLILALIGIAVIGASVYLLKNQFSNNGTSEGTASPSPIASMEPLPSPSPSPTVDRSKFKIRILNGTETSGLAASVSAKLKGLGYQIEKTGNAPSQDHKTTEVKTKASATGLADQLVSDLAPDYTASSAGTLKDSDTADGEVILGK